MSLKIQFVSVGLLAQADYDERTGSHLRHDLPPGVAQWMMNGTGEIRSLLFTCPCGCQVLRTVPVMTTLPNPKAWHWDGNEQLPTLSPSIQIIGECGWHGHLIAGEWRTC